MSQGHNVPSHPRSFLLDLILQPPSKVDKATQTEWGEGEEGWEIVESVSTRRSPTGTKVEASPGRKSPVGIWRKLWK